MKRVVLTGLILFACCSTGFSQIRYSLKLETGYLNFSHTTINVDPGPNWKGYFLNEEQNGIDLNLINGVIFREKLFAGIGTGYMNFEGIHGMSIFSDFEYRLWKRKVTPLVNTKFGYSHIWNQYENGKGTALLDVGAGLRYGLNDRTGIYIKSGFLMTQQSFLIPVRVGVSF